MNLIISLNSGLFIVNFTDSQVISEVKKSGEYMIDLARNMNIVASNDINEDTLAAIIDQGHELNTLGIGTHMVTCQAQPALGGVYKLVWIDGRDCIKLSEDLIKIPIPGRKVVYRLFDGNDIAITDIMMLVDEAPPMAGEPIMCRHPFHETVRVNVIPTRVEKLHQIWIQDGVLVKQPESLHEARARVQRELTHIRPDHLRRVNPTPYKVSVSNALYNLIHELWASESPVEVIS